MREAGDPRVAVRERDASGHVLGEPAVEGAVLDPRLGAGPIARGRRPSSPRGRRTRRGCRRSSSGTHRRAGTRMTRRSRPRCSCAPPRQRRCRGLLVTRSADVGRREQLRPVRRQLERERVRVVRAAELVEVVVAEPIERAGGRREGSRLGRPGDVEISVAVERGVERRVPVVPAERRRPLQRRAVAREPRREDLGEPERGIGVVGAGCRGEVLRAPGCRLSHDHRPTLPVELDVERDLVGLVAAEAASTTRARCPRRSGGRRRRRGRTRWAAHTRSAAPGVVGKSNASVSPATTARPCASTAIPRATSPKLPQPPR